MSSINLQKSAVDKIMQDDGVIQWSRTREANKVPFLGYFRRSYSMYNDGTEVEHGDGFTLTTIDPQNAEEARGIVIKPVTLVSDIDILVGGDKTTMSRRFSIGWSKWKFTYEPETTS